MKSPRVLFIVILLFVAVLLCTVCMSRRSGFVSKKEVEMFKPIRPSKRTIQEYTGPIRNDQSIFVSVASYRDRMCSKTVKDMLEKAKRPDRVFVGIVQQNKYDPNDAQVHERESCDVEEGSNEGKHPNVRSMTLDYTEARGPCYARYLCSGLYRGETYFLQIDSHTTFVQDWDEKLVRMMREIGSNNALSYYPNSDTQIQDDKFISFIGNVNMNTDPAMPVFGAETNTTGQLKRSVGVAGGFLAFHGNVLKRVPFDPSLDNLFMGEELLYAARLFTHGVDIYSPYEPLAYHFYTRTDEPKYWDDLKPFQDDKNPKERVYEILGMKHHKPEFGKYALGKRRSVHDYFKLIKLNPKTLKTV